MLGIVLGIILLPVAALSLAITVAIGVGLIKSVKQMREVEKVKKIS